MILKNHIIFHIHISYNSAALHLGLYYLPISHEKDARLKCDLNELIVR